MTTIPEHLKFDRSITVADLVSQFNLLLLAGRSDELLTHVSSPQAAVAGSFISLYQDKAVADLPAGKAFICLTNNIIGASLKRSHPEATLLVCDNPRRMSAQILTEFFCSHESLDKFVSETAIIDPSSFIHPDALVGPYAVVGPECHIGPGAVIGAHAVLERKVVLAENCRISANCWLANAILGESVKLGPNSVVGKRGFGFDGQGSDAQLIPHLGRVLIGEGCDIGSGVSIDRGVIDDTCIGSHVMIDNLVHIAHNVCIGDNTIILGQVGIAGSVTVEANCVIGGQAGIADHVYLCEGVIVASKSGVTKNIFKPGTYAGFPAEPARGFWAQQAALRRLINKSKKAK